ncbi:MAG: hypothetical protein ABJN80_04095, partial [Luteolibacter sp.]
VGFDAGKWREASRIYRRLMGMGLERKTLNAKLETPRKSSPAAGKNEAVALEAAGVIWSMRDLRVGV